MARLASPGCRKLAGGVTPAQGGYGVARLALKIHGSDFAIRDLGWVETMNSGSFYFPDPAPGGLFSLACDEHCPPRSCMSRLLFFITALLSILAPAHSEPAKTSVPEGPREVTQRFYDQYVKVKDTTRWIAESHSVTRGLKKAFAVTMKSPDTESDPIVEGQDVPKSGFKASQADIKGSSATVVMTSSDPGFKQHMHVRLVFDGKVWLIDGVDQLNAK